MDTNFDAYLKLAGSVFEFIYYPDSTIYGSLDKIRSNCLTRSTYLTFICHDKDLADDWSPSEDEVRYKKRHYHVIFDFGHTTRISSVFKLIDAVPECYSKPMGISIRVIPAHSLQETKAYRYLAHMDELEKTHYDPKLIFSTLDELELAKRMQYSNQSQEDKALSSIDSIYMDLQFLIHRNITLKEFLKNHPEFIYKAGSLQSLIKIMTDILPGS